MNIALWYWDTYCMFLCHYVLNSRLLFLWLLCLNYFITLLQHVRGQSALCCQINVCMYSVTTSTNQNCSLHEELCRHNLATATVDAVLLKIKVVCHVGTLFLSVLLCIMFRASSYFWISTVVRYVHCSQAIKKAPLGFHICSWKACFVNKHIYRFVEGTVTDCWYFYRIVSLSDL